jgi:hypothetical protein
MQPEASWQPEATWKPVLASEQEVAWQRSQSGTFFTNSDDQFQFQAELIIRWAELVLLKLTSDIPERKQLFLHRPD